MSTVQVQGRSGRKITQVAPTGGLTAGDLYAFRTGTDGWCGVVELGAAVGENAVIAIGQHCEVTKNTGTGESFAVGAKVYHDASTDAATASATGNDLAGACTIAAGTADTKVWLMLGPSV